MKFMMRSQYSKHRSIIVFNVQEFRFKYQRFPYWYRESIDLYIYIFYCQVSSYQYIITIFIGDNIQFQWLFHSLHVSQTFQPWGISDIRVIVFQDYGILYIIYEIEHFPRYGKMLDIDHVQFIIDLDLGHIIILYFDSIQA